jgi:hypothetical protein
VGPNGGAGQAPGGRAGRSGDEHQLRQKVRIETRCRNRLVDTCWLHIATGLNSKLECAFTGVLDEPRSGQQSIRENFQNPPNASLTEPHPEPSENSREFIICEETQVRPCIILWVQGAIRVGEGAAPGFARARSIKRSSESAAPAGANMKRNSIVRSTAFAQDSW